MTTLIILPNFTKNINEVSIVRCWLVQLFKCVFECANFNKCVFNPEIDNILLYY